ncbi:putative quinol monooxygenase [Mycoplasma hafezii]|uniref:putative quinol monooxygenase n=1 Tax=Mycoplasma hafezii TaxID=525886 RepID=UPI003CF0ED1D
MIFAKATTFIINPEKTKPFLDYMFVLSKKTRMLEMNLSFEYGLQSDDKVVLIERWSSLADYNNFVNDPNFSTEFKTLTKMAKKVSVLYEFETIK